MKAITEYEIINHGVEHSDYFQGCGTAFTEWKEALDDALELLAQDVATGIGYSEKEALDDALELLAQSEIGWDVEGNAELTADLNKADTTDVITPIVEGHEDYDSDYGYESPWVHVSVRVR